MRSWSCTLSRPHSPRHSSIDHISRCFILHPHLSCVYVSSWGTYYDHHVYVYKKRPRVRLVDRYRKLNQKLLVESCRWWSNDRRRISSEVRSSIASCAGPDLERKVGFVGVVSLRSSNDGVVWKINPKYSNRIDLLVNRHQSAG